MKQGFEEEKISVWDRPVCKSGHYGLDPTGRIVKGLDEEVPGLEMIMNKARGRNLMSDMRLVKQKKQSASACSFQS